MTDDPRSEEWHRLMDAVSFELDTDLRLHPQRLELGKAELLTDALRLPFVDIEKQLVRYIAGTDAASAEMLRRQMKSYLARLNSNPLIPLRFRMKVIHRFEAEAELFDAEMTAAVLNAHKIGVDMVQKAARSEPSYYPVLAQMLSSAIELAVRQLRLSLERYQAPAVITTRQVFDLARLGLSILPLLDRDAAEERARLQRGICAHELLRMLDFYGKSPIDQRLTWKELQRHIGRLEARLCRRDEPTPAIGDEAVMVTSLARPNDAARVLSALPSPLIADSLAVPMDAFIGALVADVARAEQAMRDSRHPDLYTEEALQATLIGGNAILSAVRVRPRGPQRQENAGTRVTLEWSPRQSFVESFAAMQLSSYEHAPSGRDLTRAWMVADISDKGVGLERTNGKALELGVDALVGLGWAPHHNEPMLGFIRWIKEPKPGEQRMGIEFFGQGYRLFRGSLLGGRADDAYLSERRSWPVLLKPGKAFHTAIFPENRIFRAMSFMLSQEAKMGYFKVAEVTKTGPNYCICKVVPASTGSEKR